MTLPLFGRVMEAEIGDVLVRDLRLSLEMTREGVGSSLKGDLRIYNLSSEREAQVEEAALRKAPLIISAGYEGSVSVIAECSVKRFARELTAVDRITRLTLQGLSRVAPGVVTLGYQGERSLREIITALVRALGPGFSLGASVSLVPEDVLVDWSWDGPISSALTMLLEPLGVAWHDADGRIRFTRPGYIDPEGVHLTLGPETGLIGSPTRTEKGAEALMRLEPRLRVGALVTLESEALDGTWKVNKMGHQADNREGSFTTSAQLRSTTFAPGDDESGEDYDDLEDFEDYDDFE